MKVYHGWRDAKGTAHVDVDGKPLDLRLDLANKSPTGFEWGYGGSGPSQLALALIADATGDDKRALERFQRFKWKSIAPLDQESEWWMTDAEVRLMSLLSRESAK